MLYSMDPENPLAQARPRSFRATRTPDSVFGGYDTCIGFQLPDESVQSLWYQSGETEGEALWMRNEHIEDFRREHLGEYDEIVWMT